MEHKEGLIEKVERYLSGKLSREEVKEEKDQNLSDDALDEAINLFETSRELIELNGLREDLKSIHQEYIAEGETQPKRKTAWIWITSAMAAALLAIAIFSGVFQQGNPEFSEIFKPYPNILSMRGEEGDLSEAMLLYSSGKYQQAITEFSSITKDSLRQTVLFYEAVSALAILDLETAIKDFNELSEDPYNIYANQVKWYLGLALWQNGDIEGAKALLNTIGENEQRYEEARKLLKVL